MDLMLIIYFADVVGGIYFACLLLFLIPSLGLSFLSLEIFEQTEELPLELKKLWKFYFFVAPFFLSITLLLPSKDAIYMMAGAHFGEEAIKSSTGQKVVRLIELEIDKRIQQMEGE